MKYDYVIWDFNGTLLNDVDAGISSVNTLLAERGLPVLKGAEHYRSVFRFPIIEYYRSLGFDFEHEPYEILAPQWVALYLENVKSAELYDDVEETLTYLKKCGVKQTVLSATELNMLEGQLRDLKIRGYFEDVLGLDNIHAGSKLALAYEWRKHHPFANVLFIGDTDHDAETARALDADCALVCRGHQPKENLVKLGVSVFDTLADVREKLL